MSSDIYHSLLQNIPISCCQLEAICDEEGHVEDFKFLEVNDCYARKTGKERVYFTGKRIGEAFPELHPSQHDWLKVQTRKLQPGKTIEIIRKCLITEHWNKIQLYCIDKNRFFLVLVDITLEQKAKKASRELQRFHKALFEISSSEHYIDANIYDFLQMLTPILTDVMKVWRAGVWFFDNDGDKLRCMQNYDSEKKEHSSGMLLSGFNHNEEYYYLRKDRYVDAFDATEDPRVKGYLNHYILPLGIASMLDVAIIAGGNIKGVLCLEHKGKKRKWDEHEITFACRVADQIAIVMGIFEKKVAQNKLQQSEARLKSIFSTAPNGMGLISARNFLEVNGQFCEMTGYPREEVVG